jgi:hypothetical protein
MTPEEKEQDRTLRLAATKLGNIIKGLEDRLDETSEDSYATRNELRDKISQFSQFQEQVIRTTPGKPVDLTAEITDYGYDAEAAASDRMCGLDYVSDYEREKEVYESSMEQIERLIEELKRTGLVVKSGVITVDPPD